MLNMILNSKKIRYDVMKPLVEKHLPEDTELITIYIDINAILSYLYSSNFLKEHKINDDRETRVVISSEMANIVAHYRHFFWSRYRVSTKFYLIHSEERATYNLLRNSNYKKTFYKERAEDNLHYHTINELIKKNMKLCDILFKYIPDAYMINSGDVEPSAVPKYFIDKDTNEKNTNIILTDDVLQYQLVNCKRTFILKFNGQYSSIITRSNLYERVTKMDDVILSPELYPLYLAFQKSKRYELDSIKGIGKKKSIDIINKALEKGIFMNTKYMNIDQELDEMVNEKIIKDENKSVIKRNFECISYDLIISNLSERQKNKIDDQIVYIPDNATLMTVNNKFYELYPIMLMELMEGVK